MNLTGHRYEREGKWKGPRIAACWFDFAAPERRIGLKKSAKFLLEQCKRYDISCCICKIPFDDMPEPLRNPESDFGKYKKRWVRVVPFFIEAMMARFNEPLFYMHVDTTIITPPPIKLFAGSIRLAEGQSNAFPGTGSRRTHILGSPVFVGNDGTAKAFIQAWKAKCSDTTNTFGEHYLLKTTFTEMRDKSAVDLFNTKMCSRALDGSYMYV